MKIVSIGGGPAGLYFALLLKKARPDVEVTVLERNQADDTFGFGVVFSDETLGNFETADPESFAEIRRRFIAWGDIETYFGGACVRSTGHGFCGLSRRRLLQILHRRCESLGVKLEFGQDLTGLDRVAGADVVLAADGANSFVRTKLADRFRPRIELGKARFCWLGADLQLPAFTFVFRESEHGLFTVHAYPYETGQSTFIVECHETTWRRAGLDRATEADTVAYVSKLFADHLRGARLLTNKSIWRAFPTVTCETWHDGNVVLIGDAAHTAHFSIGSGTKLAMEDAISLAGALARHGARGVEKAIEEYESERMLECLKLQRAARTSREWFENAARYRKQDPVAFTFNLLTRSKRITYDNLRVRDPELVRQVDESFAKKAGTPRRADGSAAPPMFAPITLRGLTLANRVVVSPMCQYSSVDGAPNDWHLVHLGSRAVGGAGLVIAEMTNVSAVGRITHGCAGIYRDEHVPAWKRVVDFVHGSSPAKIGLQLGHAGRKGSCRLPWEGDDPLRDGSAWTTLAPSAAPYGPGWHAPKAMDRSDMERVLGEYVAAAQRADRAEFDLIELHMAHGYLLSSFLSPKANLRRDEFGGAVERRMRFPLEVFDAVRRAWPDRKPISVRISATDWLDDDGGFTADEAVALARALRERGCDLVDVSTGGNTPESKPDFGRMYQVPFAEKVRYEAGIPVMAVGAILGADHVNTVVGAERADLCAIARAHLVDPYRTLHAAAHYGFADQRWPNQYLPAKPK